jgi:diguanylate cyclase (GGDEF)-like protein/PAS domain S-box-containing protein
MFAALSCLAYQHDWRLVGLAVLVCSFSGIAAIELFRRGHSSRKRRGSWIVTAGLVTGCGIWATHFIGMLAYRPGIEVAYDIPLTILSLLTTAGITTLGFWLAVTAPSRYAAIIGGGLVGMGIAVMHYLGMAALEMPAKIIWSLPLVIVSIALGVILSSAALSIASFPGKAAGIGASATLSLAILAHHFTAMAAVSAVADPSRSTGRLSFDETSLALAIAGAAAALLGMGLIAALYDRRLSLRAAQYARDQRALIIKSEEQLRARNIQLDAALNNMSQALCMFDSNARLIICNGRYARLFAMSPELQRPGTPLEDILSHKISLGMFPGEDAEAYKRERLTTAASLVAKNSVLEFKDGRVFSVWHQPMAEGGWVATHEDITEQTNAQRELRGLYATLEQEKLKADCAAVEAQAAHRQLVDASNLMGEGLVLFDSEDRYVLWNQRFAELLGEALPTLVVGGRFEESVREGARKGRYFGAEEATEEWVARRMTGHRLPENSFEMQLAGGRWIRVDERRTADGGSIGVRIDITELKRREESLRLLFQGNPLPMFVFDKETLRFLDVNDAAVIHYGWTRAEFLEMTLFDIRPAEDAAKLRAIAGSRDGSHLNGAVWRHHKANGEEIEVAIYSRLLEHEGRAAALVAVVDVTQSKRAEAMARQSQEFLNSVIENVPAPIIVKDARSLQHILINRAAEAFLGLPAVGVVGKSTEDIYPPESAAFVAERDRFTLQHREELFHGEHSIETPGNGSRYVTSKRVPIFDDKDAPRYLLTVINDLTDRKNADARIAHLSSHDLLTGLPNRAAFGERLCNVLDNAAQQAVAVLCIDLDRFKDVNDIHGHNLADRALANVARRLHEAAGDAYLSRVGGDEFNLIVVGAIEAAAIAEIADALLSSVAGGVAVDGIRINVGLSIGIAIGPTDGTDAATLVANAEAALYRAKSEGRGIARFFEAETDKRIREFRAMEHELKAAIGLGQLRLYYQPQTNIDGDLTGFEALVRWLHPTRGLVPPGVFIPIAEASGLIVEIGAWILREACRTAASWPRGLSIAVNLSPAQFRQSDFFALVHAVLVSTELPGNRLELEITEGVLIDDSSAALAILRRAKSLGVRIALDDFGTGFSSLSYLQSFPFDKIKIDRSFIENLDVNPHSAAIVRGVLGLARGLQLPVIAEGVETEEQLAFLKREGCDEIQGYLMGRPRPIEEYSQWIENGATLDRTAKAVA